MIDRLLRKVLGPLLAWIVADGKRMAAAGAVAVVLAGFLGWTSFGPTSSDTVCADADELTAELASAGGVFANGVFDAAGDLGSSAERLRADGDVSAVTGAGAQLADLAEQDSVYAAAIEAPLSTITGWCASGGAAVAAAAGAPPAEEQAQLEADQLAQQQAQAEAQQASEQDQNGTFEVLCEVFAAELAAGAGAQVAVTSAYQAELDTATGGSRDCDLTVDGEASRLRVFVLSEHEVDAELASQGLASTGTLEGPDFYAGTTTYGTLTGSVGAIHTLHAVSRDVGEGQTEYYTVALADPSPELSDAALSALTVMSSEQDRRLSEG